VNVHHVVSGCRAWQHVVRIPRRGIEAETQNAVALRQIEPTAHVLSFLLVSGKPNRCALAGSLHRTESTA